MGYFQPGGAGTEIQWYDDNDATGGHTAGQPHSRAELAVAFPSDFVANGTALPSYRCKVPTRHGNNVGTAVTTFTDEDTVTLHDTGKIHAYSTNSGAAINQHTNLGTKIGSGSIASGRSGPLWDIRGTGAATFRGNLGLYGSFIRANGLNIAFSAAAGVTQEVMNCLIQGTGIIAFTGGLATLYNVNFMSTTTTGTLDFVVTTLDVAKMEQCTISGTGMSSLVQPGSQFTVRDLALYGSPSDADLRVSGGAGGGVAWKMVKMRWTGGKKISDVTALSTDPNNAAGEYSLFTTRVVQPAIGSPISGVRVLLEDGLGNLLVDQVTDQFGSIAFGADVLASAVRVADWYRNGSVHIPRARNPFRLSVNPFGELGAYERVNYLLNWPGSDEYSNTFGQLDDLKDSLPLRLKSGASVSMQASGIEQALIRMPEAT